jgi:hypothetical protein
MAEEGWVGLKKKLIRPKQNTAEQEGRGVGWALK